MREQKSAPHVYCCPVIIRMLWASRAKGPYWLKEGRHGSEMGVSVWPGFLGDAWEPGRVERDGGSEGGPRTTLSSHRGDLQRRRTDPLTACSGSPVRNTASFLAAHLPPLQLRGAHAALLTALRGFSFQTALTSQAEARKRGGGGGRGQRVGCEGSSHSFSK